MAERRPLEGRRALITGAGSGMGRTTALLMAERGAEVLATDIDPDTAAETAELGRRSGGSLHSAELDAGDYDRVPAIISQLSARHGPIDIAVSCAGVAPMDLLVDIPEEAVNIAIDVNLGGTYSVTRALLPGMLERGWGRLIGFSSLNAKTPPPTLGHYSAAKAAVIGFTQAVAIEAAPTVTVNCVCPGMIDTPMVNTDLELARKTDPSVTLDDVRAELAKLVPFGRLGQPEEVSHMVALLASDEASFITGQAINVSGAQEMG